MRPSSEHCPRCGSTGCGPFQKTVKGNLYDYFAHPFKGVGGWKLKWCYLPKSKRAEVDGQTKAKAIAELKEAREEWKRETRRFRSHNGSGLGWRPYGHSTYALELQNTATMLGVTERTIRRWMLPPKRIRLDQLKFDFEKRQAFKRRMVHVLIEINRGNARVLTQKINQDPIGELKDRGWLSYEGNLTEKGLSIVQQPQMCTDISPDLWVQKTSQAASTTSTAEPKGDT